MLVSAFFLSCLQRPGWLEVFRWNRRFDSIQVDGCRRACNQLSGPVHSTVWSESANHNRDETGERGLWRRCVVAHVWVIQVQVYSSFFDFGHRMTHWRVPSVLICHVDNMSCHRLGVLLSVMAGNFTQFCGTCFWCCLVPVWGFKLLNSLDCLLLQMRTVTHFYRKRAAFEIRNLII